MTMQPLNYFLSEDLGDEIVMIFVVEACVLVFNFTLVLAHHCQYLNRSGWLDHRVAEVDHNDTPQDIHTPLETHGLKTPDNIVSSIATGTRQRRRR